MSPYILAIILAVVAIVFIIGIYAIGDKLGIDIFGAIFALLWLCGTTAAIYMIFVGIANWIINGQFTLP